MAQPSRTRMMSEAELQKAIVGLARLLGWRVAHFRTANTAQGWMTPVAADGKGFPDLVLVRDGRLVFAELKADKGRVSPEQDAWLEELRLVPGVTVAVFKPSDWTNGAVDVVLREAA